MVVGMAYNVVASEGTRLRYNRMEKWPQFGARNEYKSIRVCQIIALKCELMQCLGITNALWPHA